MKPLLGFLANNCVAASSLSSLQLVCVHVRSFCFSSASGCQASSSSANEQALGSLPSRILNSKLLRSDHLIVNRGVEWLTLLAGVEQANLYSITDGAGRRLGLIAEEAGGTSGILQRQLFRTHRRFTATVFDVDGEQPLIHIHRPAYLLTGHASVTLPDGTLLGSVRREWRLFRRTYHLYCGKQQYGLVDSGFMSWGFRLQDSMGGTLGFVDRNFLGLIKEVATNAGRYVLHFGNPDAARQAKREEEAPVEVGADSECEQKVPNPEVSFYLKQHPGLNVIATSNGDLVEVTRHMLPQERLVALACAVCIDFDYFSSLSWSEGHLHGNIQNLTLPQQKDSQPTAALHHSIHSGTTSSTSGIAAGAEAAPTYAPAAVPGSSTGRSNSGSVNISGSSSSSSSGISFKGNSSGIASNSSSTSHISGSGSGLGIMPAAGMAAMPLGGTLHDAAAAPSGSHSASPTSEPPDSSSWPGVSDLMSGGPHHYHHGTSGPTGEAQPVVDEHVLSMPDWRDETEGDMDDWSPPDLGGSESTNS